MTMDDTFQFSDLVWHHHHASIEYVRNITRRSLRLMLELFQNVALATFVRHPDYSGHCDLLLATKIQEVYFTSHGLLKATLRSNSKTLEDYVGLLPESDKYAVTRHLRLSDKLDALLEQSAGPANWEKVARVLDACQKSWQRSLLEVYIRVAVTYIEAHGCSTVPYDWLVLLDTQLELFKVPELLNQLSSPEEELMNDVYDDPSRL